MVRQVHFLVSVEEIAEEGKSRTSGDSEKS
jgi:hypothetical protein